MNIKELPEKLVEMSPELKAKVEELERQDRRQLTSPENGKAGGRKHVPVDVWARDFANARHKSGEIYTLRFFAGQWYEFRGDYWHELNRKDLESEITGFLQSQGYAAQERISNALINDILLNLNSSEICNLHSGRYRIPCFLPNGEDAAGWLPMRNAVINIEAAAVAADRGKPLPPEAQRDRSPALFATFGLDYDYDPAATCPKWEKYLSDVQPEKENREALQMLAGLALVPDCKYNVGFFLLGQAGTGKSVFVSTLIAMLGGSACTCSIPLADFANKNNLAPITEKLLNIVGEMPIMPENGRIADVEGTFKDITSGEQIRVRRLYRDAWDAKAISRLVFATNIMPAFTDRSAGVWDRVRIIPFNQVFRGTTQQNPKLAAELLDERPGVFNWALRGLAKLRKLKTFPECPEGEALKIEHRNSCDHERAFLAESTEVALGSWISSDNLYRRYKEWAMNNGYRGVGAANFKKAVKTIYPKSYTEKKRTEDGNILVFCNIRNINNL